MLDALKKRRVNAVLLPQYPSQAWALGHRHYLSIIPVGMSELHLIAFMLPLRHPVWRDYINYWLLLQQRNGLKQKLTEHWLQLRPYHHHYHWNLVDAFLGEVSVD